MEFLLSSLVLGLAGFDIFGFAILLAAHSSKASKMAIMLFAAIVFVATVVGGVTISLFFAKSISLIADYFLQLPNSLWLGLKTILIIGLCFWLYKSLSANKKLTENETKSSGWLKKGLLGMGLLFATSSFIDPSFIALTAIAGQNGNVVLIILALSIWVLVSQIPLFLLSIAIATNCHVSFIKWFETLKTKYWNFFQYLLNGTLVITIVVLVFDVIYFLTTNISIFD
jgi:cytochrome c biogenesis protein CcdA